MSITLAGTQYANIVVLRGFSPDTTVGDIENLLRSVHIVSTGIDRKVDSLGSFRGTVFVRFATPEIAQICAAKLDHSDARVHGRKVKAELLRQANRPRSYSAKEILEADSGADAKQTRVRDLVTAFVKSGRTELYLPTDLNSDQRKLAHSLAEKFGLAHTTVSPDGQTLEASPSHGGSHQGQTVRTVHLSKNRPDSRTSSFRAGATRSAASLMTAAVTNDLNKLATLMPEIPVSAVRPASNLDQLALMHASQAQAHAEAARAALEGARRSKERDAMPDWLEVVESSPRTVPNRGRSRSNLNPNAPAFIPSASFTQDVLAPPPGLTRVVTTGKH